MKRLAMPSPSVIRHVSLLFLCLFLLAGGLMVWHSWTLGIADIERNERDRLGGIASTLSRAIRGDLHESASLAHPMRDAVLSWNEADPRVRRLRRYVVVAVSENQLSTPIYTLRLRDCYRSIVEAQPDVIHEDALEFILSSTDKPYWRHTYEYRPTMAGAFFGGRTVTTGIYKDVHGSWVSAYAPILDSQGRVKAIVEVDTELNTILAAIHSRLTWRTVTAVAYFMVIVTVISWLLIRNSRTERRARLLAEEGSRSKSAFLANMSHEIRTPMTAILGFAETLLEPDLSSSERLNAVYTIHRNGKYLLRLINDILDLSKIEAEKMTVESASSDPRGIVKDVASLLGVQAQSHGISFRVEYKGTMPETIHTDPTRLKQIIINVAGNAIKFTQQGSVTLTVELVEENDRSPRLAFDVVDTGVGLTEQQVGQLFRAFTQADASTTRRFGGTGLGLTISKHLARLLGGDVVLVRSQPHQGTHFRVTVATGPLEGVKRIDPYPGAGAAPTTDEKSKAVSVNPLPAGCRILLAEDGLDNQRLIMHILRRAGVEVTLVENGRHAVDAALSTRDGRQPFDIILMDIQMPVMDGYKATAELRRQGYEGPIIALTAHAMEHARARCLESGCNDYATKPIDRSKLIDLLRYFMSQAEPVTMATP